MIPYIIHASILLSFSFLAYMFLLRQETFFKINRVFLIAALVLSVGLPLLEMPQSLSFRKPVVIQVQEESPLTENASPELALNLNNLESSAGIEKAETKSNSILEANSEQVESNFISSYSLSASEILWIIYLGGVIVFILTFLIQFSILCLKKRNLEHIQDGKFKIYELKENTAPFSFLNWIFINPELYDFETFTNIVEHEKIHVSQAHYLDKLIAELAVIAFWFNPFVWFHRKAINNNLEFLTDEEMLKKGTERESYQMNLLKVCVPQHALSITTNYNESFLSERIKMMNSKKSSARSSWKYLLILPMIGFTLATLNAVRPSYSEKLVKVETNNSKFDALEKVELSNANTNLPKGRKEKQKKAKTKISGKTASKSEHELLKEKKLVNKEELKIEEAEVDLDILVLEEVSKEMKRLNSINDTENQKEHIHKHEQKEEHKSNHKNSNSRREKDHQFPNVKTVLGEHNNRNIKPGFWRGIVDEDQVCFFMNNSKSSNQQWTMNECFQINEIRQFSLGKDVEFYIEREAGTIYFVGSFDGNYEGIGKFKFEGNESYVEMLQNYGITEVREEDLFMLFLSNTKKDFIRYLDKKDYDFNLKELVELGIFKVDKNRIAEYEEIFEMVDDEGNLRDMVNMSIHGVNSKDVKSYVQLSPDDLSLSRVMEAKIHGVTPEFIKAVKEELDYEQISLQKIIQFKIHGLNVAAMQEFKNIGFENVSPNKLVEFTIHGIDANYIEKIRSMGYDDMNPQKFIEFKIHGINHSYIESLKGVGFNDLRPHELVEGKIHGVSATYIESLKQEGIKNISFRKAIEGKIHGVNANFIKRGKQKGYSPDDMASWIKLAIHGF